VALPAAMSTFERYIGIDYSGAETPTAGLTGLRAYEATPASAPREITPPAGSRKHWTRKALAGWLAERLAEPVRTLAGVDHGFSFPLEYFEAHRLPEDWVAFLDDFQHHWPTDDDIYVDFVREGVVGAGAERTGNSRWRRLTERRAGSAKSVFHFDVPGSVAKSTHAGLPWLRRLRRELGDRLHVWPFDGWSPRAGRSVLLEVYPSLWRHAFARKGRTSHQHDAYTIAAWMRQADLDRTLEGFLTPDLEPEERARARVEGWILGVA